MKKRVQFYYKLLRWTSIPLLIVMWLLLMTGPAVFKGQRLHQVTLGLLDPAASGKWHSVWLPPIGAVIFYIHTTLGLQVLAQRTQWLKPKKLWEILVFAIGILALAQFLVLFYG